MSENGWVCASVGEAFHGSKIQVGRGLWQDVYSRSIDVLEMVEDKAGRRELIHGAWHSSS